MTDEQLDRKASSVNYFITGAAVTEALSLVTAAGWYGSLCLRRSKGVLGTLSFLHLEFIKRIFVAIFTGDSNFLGEILRLKEVLIQNDSRDRS